MKTSLDSTKYTNFAQVLFPISFFPDRWRARKRRQKHSLPWQTWATNALYWWYIDTRQAKPRSNKHKKHFTGWESRGNVIGYRGIGRMCCLLLGPSCGYLILGISGEVGTSWNHWSRSQRRLLRSPIIEEDIYYYILNWSIERQYRATAFVERRLLKYLATNNSNLFSACGPPHCYYVYLKGG